MAAHEDKRVPSFKIPQLLHPELMSEEDLRTVLADRRVSLRNIDSMNKHQLVDVVHRVAMPLPQRDCFKKTETRAYYFNPSSVKNSTLVTPVRDLNPTNKRLNDCINYGRKTIKIMKKLDSSAPEINKEDKRCISLKKSSAESETKELCEQAPGSEKSPPIKRLRAKISWP